MIKYDHVLSILESYKKLQKTDFSPAYGIVTDKFGITFQIYTGED